MIGRIVFEFVAIFLVFHCTQCWSNPLEHGMSVDFGTHEYEINPKFKSITKDINEPSKYGYIKNYTFGQRIEGASPCSIHFASKTIIRNKTQTLQFSHIFPTGDTHALTLGGCNLYHLTVKDLAIRWTFENISYANFTIEQVLFFHLKYFFILKLCNHTLNHVQLFIQSTEYSMGTSSNRKRRHNGRSNRLFNSRRECRLHMLFSQFL